MRCPASQRAPSRHRRQRAPPAGTPRAAERRRFPPHAARLVPRATDASLPWRDDARPVPHPRLRGDAAADAGGSRAAEVPRVAGEVSVARGTGRRRRGASSTETWRPLGYNIRPRRLQAIAREAVSTLRRRAAARRGDAARRSRDWAATPSARSGASRSASAPPSSTPTSRACCSACSSGAASRRPRHDPAALAISESVLPRAHVFDFNQALMDFGATVCTARKPRCRECPLRRTANRCAC